MKTKTMNLEKLHSHFLDGNITKQYSGKTTAVVYQAIGFAEVLFSTNIYILCQQQDISHIHTTLSVEFQKRYNYSWLEFPEFNKVKFRSNTIIIKTFDSYMNKDNMNVNHSSEEYMVLFDYRNMTSVNTSPETIFKVMGRSIREVVASMAYGVSQAFGGIPIDIQID